MCRLMMFNRGFAIEHTEAEIGDVFNRLNTIQGGHGMGVFLSGEKPILKKGLKMKGKDLARVVYKSLHSKTPFNYCMFHCRLAGPAGSICDENSQPYYDVESDMSLAHNGVASELCNSRYDYSDTELLLRIMCDYGIPIRNLDYFSGVFIGTNQGVPFIVKGAEWTDLELLYNEDTGAWCAMSVALYPLTKKPYKVVPIKKCVWQGHDVSSLYIDGLSHKHNRESYRTMHLDHSTGRWVDDEEPTYTRRSYRDKSISEMTDDEWREYQADIDNEWDQYENVDSDTGEHEAVKQDAFTTALTESMHEENKNISKLPTTVTHEEVKRYLETGTLDSVR